MYIKFARLDGVQVIGLMEDTFIFVCLHEN
jgi:hypothetical protein